MGHLQYLSDDMRSDKDIIWNAMLNCQSNIQFALIVLDTDLDFLYKVLDTNLEFVYKVLENSLFLLYMPRIMSKQARLR